MKQMIRLTESDLHRIVEESVRILLNEYGEGGESQKALGALYMRKMNNVRSMDDKDMEDAREIATRAAEKRMEHGIPVSFFVDGMNKQVKKKNKKGV